jgi:hypothetical protein
MRYERIRSSATSITKRDSQHTHLSFPTLTSTSSSTKIIMTSLKTTPTLWQKWVTKSRMWSTIRLPMLSTFQEYASSVIRPLKSTNKTGCAWIASIKAWQTLTPLRKISSIKDSATSAKLSRARYQNNCRYASLVWQIFSMSLKMRRFLESLGPTTDAENAIWLKLVQRLMKTLYAIAACSQVTLRSNNSQRHK